MIDHILWAVPDLQAGVADMARRCGVTPRPGGRHPGIGTHNALLGLDGARYLELIAPDPTQSTCSAFGEWVRGVESATLLTWCARCDDLDALAHRARALGLEPSPISAMERRRPDGSTLAWRLLFVHGHDFGLHMPFVIDWRDSPHPSAVLPDPLGLRTLQVGHPQAQRLDELLRQLLPQRDPALRISATSRPTLRAQLTTPAGELNLTDHEADQTSASP